MSVALAAAWTRGALGGLVIAAAAWAPIQCGSPPRERPEFEDSPAEALHVLADQFGEAGDVVGRRRTLRFLVERYPSSRFSPAAREELGPDASDEQAADEHAADEHAADEHAADEHAADEHAADEHAADEPAL